MKTFYFLAVPQFSDLGMKPEVLYMVQGVMSQDNPLTEFYKGRESADTLCIKGLTWCRKVYPRKMLRICKDAKRISSAFYGAWARYYFNHSINTVYDPVLLSDSELVENYNYLLQEKESTGDEDAFLKGCYDLSIRQKVIDMDFWRQEAKEVHEKFYDYYYYYPFSSPNKVLEEYFARKYLQKEAEINLLRDRLGVLDYAEFKEFTSRCSATECNWFSVMRRAKLIKPVIRVAKKRVVEDNPFTFGKKLVNYAQDMSAERLSFLMLRGYYYYRFGYDFYFACSDRCA